MQSITLRSFRKCPFGLFLMNARLKKTSENPSKQAPKHSEIDAFRRKLFYQSSYRGMAEMEYILHSFAENHLQTLNGKELKEWQKILDTGDSDLYKWIVQKKLDAVSKTLREQKISRKLIDSLREIDISNKHVPAERLQF